MDIKTPETNLIWLNKVNGADIVEYKYAKRCMSIFEGHLIGVIMGIAYGGSVEAIANLWKDRGLVIGYDTFEDLHPVHLAQNPNHFEAKCMDHWYLDRIHGTKNLNFEYQSDMLESLFPSSWWELRKGEVREDSCKHLRYINYAFLDMDILASMRTGYEAVKHKIVKDGYLLMHDTDHINTLTPWFKEEVMGKDGHMWEIAEDLPQHHIVVLKRTAL